MTQSSIDTIRNYHQRTKHHLPNRYAAGPQGLDWDAQPDAFRHFAGADKVPLPLGADNLQTRFADVYTKVQAQPLSLQNLGVLLELSMGLSAWKAYGEDRWALRCNPSSGNLHPTEVYLITPKLDGLAEGVYHYHSYAHELEHRCLFKHNPIPDGMVGLALSSIHWREAWKYGERAFRYCQHDVGHALAALRYAAASLGWKLAFDDTWADSEIAQVLGLDRFEDFTEAELEVPDVFLWLNTSHNVKAPEHQDILTASQSGQWKGQANRLSEEHMRWDIIDTAHKATAKPATETPNKPASSWNAPLACKTQASAADLIRQRRSMQACDPQVALPSEAFFRILDTTLPRSDTTPWDVWPYTPRVHLMLFVHRVSGLMPGLYVLARHADGIEMLQKAFKNSKFEWKKPENCPEHLPLYQFLVGNAANAAQVFSCHQEIASHGAFSLGMLAEFDAALEQGAWQYRRLFWEAGMIGQVLYLEAEAAGIQGTGIGCYFDDAVHELLGLKDTHLQSLYHFTLGKGLIDKRLQTLPPYAHLQ